VPTAPIVSGGMLVLLRNSALKVLLGAGDDGHPLSAVGRWRLRLQDVVDVRLLRRRIGGFADGGLPEIQRRKAGHWCGRGRPGRSRGIGACFGPRLRLGTGDRQHDHQR